MTDLELSKIRAEAGRKGGKKKVPKGFAVTGDAKEKSEKAVNAKRNKRFIEGF